MIDHLLGRPSVSWKRSQVFLIVFFWLWRISNGAPDGPRILYIRRINRFLKRYTPWQIIVSTLTIIYGARHLDSILGVGSPEPLARLYSRSYYRATWIVTGLDAGFATAMNIKPKWLRDLCSVLFSFYYVFYANEADEKLRRFRATCTVETLRVTWEKTGNPILRMITLFDRPSLPVVRQILIPRPPNSKHRKPITAWLFWSRPEIELESTTDLILDFPGGGFVSLSPTHHEERLRRWALLTGRPVLSIDYGKAPEYPYPWAIEEGFDVYQVLVESQGAAIGMSGKVFNIIMSGDSAGANLVCGVTFKILESSKPIQHPTALILNYACLDFNFGSWMSATNLQVLKTEASSGHLPGVAESKDHFNHRSPLSVVRDVGERRVRHRKSWGKSLTGIASRLSSGSIYETQASPTTPKTPANRPHAFTLTPSGDEADDEEYYPLEEHEKPISQRVRYTAETLRQQQPELEVVLEEEDTKAKEAQKRRVGTKLTMTSRTGYFQDRIITPAMMRAMAILYLGMADPDFEQDYHISPILAPPSLLAKFPPMLMTCGEKDPFVDDTVIFAGRVREAKRAWKSEYEERLRTKGAKYSESLRMTSLDSAKSRILHESEDDWVQMEIFEGWSHGYLQMTALMPEVKGVINRIGEWADGAFLRFGRRILPAQPPRKSQITREISPQPAGTRRGSHSKRQKPDMDPAIVLTSGTETEGEGLTMVIRKRRSPPPSFSTSSTVKPSHSSEETLVGGPTPGVGGPGAVFGNTNPAKVAMKILTEAELMRRRRADAVEGM